MFSIFYVQYLSYSCIYFYVVLRRTYTNLYQDLYCTYSTRYTNIETSKSPPSPFSSINFSFTCASCLKKRM